jgi:hypothetical protein
VDAIGGGVAAIGGGVTGMGSVGGSSVGGSTAGGGSGVAGPGFCSGEYHLPSDAIHQPGPCDASLKAAPLPA